MTFEELQQIENEASRVNFTYDIFNEDTRLKSKSGRVEFITSVRYLEKYLKVGDKILDNGAGAGEYSLYFAKKGYEVHALELSDANIKAFQAKITPELALDLIQGNALDLSCYADDSFDVVLVFGPLYHLEKDADKKRVIAEAKRVCKKDGIIAFAFINHDFVFLTEIMYNTHYFSTQDYNHDTMRLNNFPFVFSTVTESTTLLEESGLEILHRVAADGPSELLAEQIEDMTEEEYAQYLKYMEMICEKPEVLGMTNHLLYLTKNHK